MGIIEILLLLFKFKLNKRKIIMSNNTSDEMNFDDMDFLLGSNDADINDFIQDEPTVVKEVEKPKPQTTPKPKTTTKKLSKVEELEAQLKMMQEENKKLTEKVKNSNS